MVFRSFFLCAVQYMSFRQSLFRAKLKVKLYSPRVPIFLCAQRSFINSFECRFESLCSHWFEVFSEGAFIFSNPCFIISNKEDFRKTQNLPSKIFTFFFPLKEDKSGRTVVWPPKIQITYLAECRPINSIFILCSANYPNLTFYIILRASHLQFLIFVLSCFHW